MSKLEGINKNGKKLFLYCGLSAAAGAVFAGFSMLPGIGDLQEQYDRTQSEISELEENLIAAHPELAAMNTDLITLYRMAATMSEESAAYCGNDAFGSLFQDFTEETIQSFLRENTRSYVNLPAPIDEMPEGFTYSDLSDFVESVSLQEAIGFLEQMRADGVHFLRTHDLYQGGFIEHEDNYESSLIMFFPDRKIFTISSGVIDAISLMALYEEIRAANFYEGETDVQVWRKDYDGDRVRDFLVPVEGNRQHGYLLFDNGIRTAPLNLEAPCPNK